MTTTASGRQHVHVVGAGLMGTSIGLALRAAGVHVTLEDANPEVALISAERGAGHADTGGSVAADVICVAVPPSVTVDALLRNSRINPTATLLDIASVKAKPIAQAETLGLDMSRYVPSHPLAGRERGGPTAGRADLFQGRSWVVTPTPSTDLDRLAVVIRLVELCGARAVRMDPVAHDEAVALVSHLPQLVASLVAGELIEAPFDVSTVAGQGLRDATRIAASDPQLWAEICVANAEHIAPLVDRMRAQLDALSVALRGGDAGQAVGTLVARGQTGHARLGSTHGRPSVPVEVVTVVLRDRPGELARIFNCLDRADVNVEDVQIDHAPGERVGVVELVVAMGDGATAVQALIGWTAQVNTSINR